MQSSPPPPEILFASPLFVVLNKPAGLPAHPGRAGGPSAEDWFPALSRRRDGPWLAHRLDTDTAGCLVVALRKAPLLAAQQAFAAGRAGKVYWAVARGAPPTNSGTIDTPLARHEDAHGWRMAADKSGQAAITDWTVRGTAGGLTWLELRPRTGRTHQLRVHCALLGCPILGDTVYGLGEPGGLLLLARAITLPLTPPVTVTAPPPAHMRAALAECGFMSPSSDAA